MHIPRSGATEATAAKRAAGRARSRVRQKPQLLSTFLNLWPASPSQVIVNTGLTEVEKSRAPSGRYRLFSTFLNLLPRRGHRMRESCGWHRLAPWQHPEIYASVVFSFRYCRHPAIGLSLRLLPSALCPVSSGPCPANASSASSPTRSAPTPALRPLHRLIASRARQSTCKKTRPRLEPSGIRDA